MKKITALLIVVVMAAALFAIPGHATSVTTKWFDKVDTDSDVINIVGWCIIDDDEIADFGYRIDDNDPVFSSLQERSAEIVSVMGSDPAKTNGFNVQVAKDSIPEGEHVLHVVVKSKGGACVDVNSDDSDGFKVTGTGANAGSTAASLLNKSWDNIFVDGEQMVEGSAGSWLDSNEIKGEISEVELRGWAHISTTISGFAYTIDDGKAVKSADFIEDRQDVKGLINADAEGFRFKVDVSNVGKGAHTIKIYAVDANGELVDTLFACPFTQEKEATGGQPATNPATADAAIIAVAAVACIALAGVVIAKKVK